MARKKKVPVEDDNPPVDLVKEELPLPVTEKVECEIHGSQPRVNFVLDGEILAKYCFHCYAESFEKTGIKNFIRDSVTVKEL